MRSESGNPDVHLKVTCALPAAFAAAATHLSAVCLLCMRRPAPPAHRPLNCTAPLPAACRLISRAPLPLLQVCDLASLAAIKALAEDYLSTGSPLDLLINK